MSRLTLLWNSLSGIMLYLVTMATAFVMAPFLVHHLGNGQYGFWELLMGLVGYLGILDLGVGPALVRHVALALGQKNHEQLVRVVNTAFVAFLCTGALGGALMALGSISPSIVFGAHLPLGLSESRQVMWLCALVFFLTFTRATFTASLMGFQHHRIVNSIRAVLTVLQAVAVWELLTHSSTDALAKIAAVSVVGLTLETAVTSLILFHVLQGKLDPRKASWQEGRTLFAFGAKSVGLMSAGTLTYEALLFVLSHVLGAASVTFYVVSARLIRYGGAFITSIGFPLTPYLATSFGHRGMEGARESFGYTTRVMQFIQAGVAMGVLWLGLPFLSHWMGAEYALRGAMVFYCLAISMGIGTFSSNSSRTLLSLNQHGRAALASIALSALAFALALFLIPRWGLAGAAFSAAAFQISFGLVQLTLVCRALKISILAHIRGTIQRLAAPLFFGSIALALTVRLFPPKSYPAILLCATAGALAYLITGFFTVPKQEERQALYAHLRRRFFRAVTSA